MFLTRLGEVEGFLRFPDFETDRFLKNSLKFSRNFNLKVSYKGFLYKIPSVLFLADVRL